MSFQADPEPDEHGLIIYVGQDRAGHWLVQDSGHKLEGRFVSRSAAISYATGEAQVYHASIEVTLDPLVPLISFAPVSPDERVFARAA